MTTDLKADRQAYEALIDAVAPFCDCCPECCDHPCAGVMAGGLCDQMRCTCDDWWEADEKADDDDL